MLGGGGHIEADQGQVAGLEKVVVADLTVADDHGGEVFVGKRWPEPWLAVAAGGWPARVAGPRSGPAAPWPTKLLPLASRSPEMSPDAASARMTFLSTILKTPNRRRIARVEPARKVDEAAIL